MFVVDKVASRLRLAEQIGAIPVDYSAADPIETIREQTRGDGTDKGIDAVGYQATVGEGEEQPAPGDAQFRGIQGAAAVRRAGCLRPVRPARGGLLQGRPQARCLTAA